MHSALSRALIVPDGSEDELDEDREDFFSEYPDTPMLEMPVALLSFEANMPLVMAALRREVRVSSVSTVVKMAL